MLHLVLKDFLIQKKNLFLVFSYPVFMFFVFQGPAFRSLVYAMGTVMMTYILIANVLTIEETSKAHLFVNSLPIPRSQVVAARYLTVIAFASFGFCFMVLVGMILRSLFAWMIIPNPGLSDLALAVGLSLLASSIYYPLTLIFGASGARVGGIIIFISAFFLPGWIGEWYLTQKDLFLRSDLTWLTNLTTVQLTMLGVGVLSIIVFTSYLVSLKLYLRQDFTG